MSSFFLSGLLAMAASGFGFVSGAASTEPSNPACCCAGECDCQECGCCENCKDGQCESSGECTCEGCTCCDGCCDKQ